MAGEATDGVRTEALRRIHDRLVEAYGEPTPGEPRRPLDEVVFTVLSQNTNDTNRDRAWERLRSRFPDWQSVVEAPTSEVAETIQVGGLHRIKAARIQEILRQVRERHGEFSLDHLEEADTAEARRELSSYKGLGSKSVNCILLFSLGRPAFPVDTHVHRVLQRVGVLETGNLGRANDVIQEDVPDELAHSLHVGLIRHGRRTCDARSPECRACCIEDLCGYEDKNLEGGAS